MDCPSVARRYLRPLTFIFLCFRLEPLDCDVDTLSYHSFFNGRYISIFYCTLTVALRNKFRRALRIQGPPELDYRQHFWLTQDGFDFTLTTDYGFRWFRGGFDHPFRLRTTRVRFQKISRCASAPYINVFLIVSPFVKGLTNNFRAARGQFPLQQAFITTVSWTKRLFYTPHIFSGAGGRLD